MAYQLIWKHLLPVPPGTKIYFEEEVQEKISQAHEAGRLAGHGIGHESGKSEGYLAAKEEFDKSLSAEREIISKAISDLKSV
jgi:hypothetical protein